MWSALHRLGTPRPPHAHSWYGFAKVSTELSSALESASNELADNPAIENDINAKMPMNDVNFAKVLMLNTGNPNIEVS